MKEVKIKTWLIWAAVLFVLSLVADYFFLHLFFQPETKDNKPSISRKHTDGFGEEDILEDDSFLGPGDSSETEQDSDATNTFHPALRDCAPEIAAQGIGTPEALMEYLKKSIGIETEDVSVENFHLALPDGSIRRVHIIKDSNTNSADKKEIRFFKLDEEGYPERLSLKPTDTLESLLALGTQTRYESKSLYTLKDHTFLEVEMHDNKVFEFQYNNQGHILSCRYSDCVCPNPAI